VSEAADIHVLVVEASDASRGFLVRILQSDPRIHVIKAVSLAQAALDFLQDHRPDLVLMSSRMPDLDGFETTRRIMETHPLPIVLCAQSASADDAVFRSLEAGAVACVEKPMEGTGAEAMNAAVAHLLQTVKLMSEVKVVRRWSRTAPAARAAGSSEAAPAGGPRVVGIGASTGGPLALQTILAALPREFPVPILAVQHIAKGFLPGMAEWLRQTSGLKVLVGAHGVQALPGHVYLAPDDFHMGWGTGGRIVLGREAPENGLRPSVAYLFRSLAEVCGANAIGVLLTGMGKDGAYELKRMRDAGATTIVQDSASSVVHGMPGEAIALGAAMHVAPADKIADMLMTYTHPRRWNERK
jgi:two-component system chemotaxis response regulator CheB